MRWAHGCRGQLVMPRAADSWMHGLARHFILLLLLILLILFLILLLILILWQEPAIPSFPGAALVLPGTLAADGGCCSSVINWC